MKLLQGTAFLLAAALPIAAFASPSTDRRIEQAANDSYNFRALLDGQVSVASNDGVVTLTGTVQDRDARSLAENTVASLPGVGRVDDRIELRAAAPEYSDAWIALKVRGLLLVKANVSAASTKVAVRDGQVTLSGTVQNAAQKDLTEEYAKGVDHVKSVRNELVVQAVGSGDTTVGETVDDASITAQIKYALLSHRSTSTMETKVTTDNSIVSISGTADSEAEIALVTKLAQDTRGVKSVVNRMTLKG